MVTNQEWLEAELAKNAAAQAPAPAQAPAQAPAPAPAPPKRRRRKASTPLSDDEVLMNGLSKPPPYETPLDDKNVLQDVEDALSETFEPWLATALKLPGRYAEKRYYGAKRLAGAGILAAEAGIQFQRELANDAFNIAKDLTLKSVGPPEEYHLGERSVGLAKAAGRAAAGLGKFANPRDVAKEYANRVTDKMDAEGINPETGDRTVLDRIREEAEIETVQYFGF